MIKSFYCFGFIASLIGGAAAQNTAPPVDSLFLFSNVSGTQSPGWAEFTHASAFVGALPSMLFAIFLGSIIAFHFVNIKSMDSVDDIESPQIYILYAFIGSMLGALVPQVPVIGIIAFGLGGLMRFRTDVGSVRHTGRLIAVTLVGVCCGLGYPLTASIAAMILYGLIYMFDRQVIFTLSVRAVPADRFHDAVTAYKMGISSAKGRLYSERRNPDKNTVTFVFTTDRRSRQPWLDTIIQDCVPRDLRGITNWDAH